MKKLTLFILFAILIAGFFVRLYKFSSPIADWHSWRQTDTSSVSKIFVNEGIDLLHPKYQNLSNVASLKNNPNGYFFVEFPIYNSLQAGGYKSLKIFTLEEWGRLITILSSLSSTLLLFLIVRRYQSDLAGLIAAFFYAFLPYSIFYGRTVLPDPSMAAAILAGIYFFDLWINGQVKRRTVYFILSAVFTSLAILLKPYALFFTLPILYLAFKKYGLRGFRNWKLYVFALISLAPFIVWRLWMLQFPQGIPQSFWLFNGDNIRFKGAYFYWIFGERIGKLILGYWGIPILALGILSKVKKDKLFFYTFLASSVMYILVVAKGNVQHDYYQYPILSTIAIFLGLGGDYLLKGKEFSYRFVGIFVFILCTCLTLMLSWYHVRDYYNINNPVMLKTAEVVDKLLPKDAKVLANYEGDATFLYYTNRKGWASYQTDVVGMKKLGADYIALVNPRASDFEYAKGYKIIVNTGEYAIIDLTQKQ